MKYPVSIFINVAGKEPRQVGALSLIKHANPTWINLVEECRRQKLLLSSADYGKFKAATLPVWTPTGTFEGGQSEVCRVSWSGLVALDIDKVANVEAVRKQIEAMPFVWAMSLSVSGDGLFAIVRITDAEGQFKGHLKALYSHFARQGIALDSSCKNPNRVRYISYDQHAYINEDAEVWTEVENEQIYTPQAPQSLNPTKDLDRLIAHVISRGIDLTQGRTAWMQIGSVINNYYSDAENMFVAMSQFHPAFKEAECRDTFRRFCSKQTRNKGVLFNIARANGVIIKNI